MYLVLSCNFTCLSSCLEFYKRCYLGQNHRELSEMYPSPVGICVAFVHLRQNILPLFGMSPQALHKANSNLQKHLRNTQVALIMFQDRIDLPHSSSLFIVFSSGLSERYSINSTWPFENTSFSQDRISAFLRSTWHFGRIELFSVLIAPSVMPSVIPSRSPSVRPNNGNTKHC